MGSPVDLVKIEGEEIVIRVRVDALPAAVEQGPHSDVARVTDAKVFAEEVVSVLQSEEEDGTTPVHRLFDDACLRAFENGAEGCEDASLEAAEDGRWTV